MSQHKQTTLDFTDLGLAPYVLNAVNDLGYEKPSPIQAEMIPHVLNGRDVIGQAQTGTGKTAAFALPLLSKVDLELKKVQVLVLTPTRELAIQVAEAFQQYASHIDDFHVLPIYGGQAMHVQLRQLKRGVHVVIGTPGRTIDHLRQKTLSLHKLQCLVLDEADEMLRMGFINDVRWIIEQTPEKRQIALFSATMPKEIRKIANQYLHNTQEVHIKAKTTTADTINQRAWIVESTHKLEAMTRILETEDFDAIIVFVRTKTMTTRLAEKLAARGYRTAPLSSDIPQAKRERTVNNLKEGNINIIIATDVAARGLDVERISHVVNYDIPYNAESYVHRIGRTGRAGKKGEAILFVSRREKHLLKTIERSTKQHIAIMNMPSDTDIIDRRMERVTEKITATLQSGNIEHYRSALTAYQEETGTEAIDIAAALVQMREENDTFLKEENEHGTENRSRHERSSHSKSKGKQKRIIAEEVYQINIGEREGIQPYHIVGALANEVGIDIKSIGRITISNKHSTIGLASGIPKSTISKLEKTKINGNPIVVSRLKKNPTKKKK